MNKKWLMVGGIGAAVAVGGIALALSTQPSGNPILMISSTGNGTVSPAKGSHTEYYRNETVLITATPDPGYAAVWRINGVELIGYLTEYSLTLTGNMTVIISFVDPNEMQIIAGIKPIGTVGVQQNFAFWYFYSWDPVDIAECDENWYRGKYTPALLQFQVFDAAGIGVPNKNVRIYPEINPDPTMYRGYLLFDGVAYTVNDPLVVTTDADGIAACLVEILYGADDVNVDGGGIELSRGTNLWAKKDWIGGSALVMPVYHGVSAGLGWLWSDHGGGGTATMTRVVRAEVVNTDKTALQQVYTSYDVEWRAPNE